VLQLLKQPFNSKKQQTKKRQQTEEEQEEQQHEEQSQKQQQKHQQQPQNQVVNVGPQCSQQTKCMVALVHQRIPSMQITPPRQQWPLLWQRQPTQQLQAHV
jgi:hypothetical protein